MNVNLHTLFMNFFPKSTIIIGSVDPLPRVPSLELVITSIHVSLQNPSRDQHKNKVYSLLSTEEKA